MEIHFDDSEVRRFANILGNFAKRGISHATRDALNKSAFEARKLWVRQMDEDLTLRNTYTTRSLRVQKARGTDMRRMEAAVGSPLQYVADRESGGVERKRGKHGVPIPTSVASGEGRGARPRKRPVRRPNWMPRIHLAKAGASGMSKSQRNAVAIAMARRAGKKHAFIETDRTKGIVRISGGRRRPKLDLVWDLSHPTIRTKPIPTLARVVDALMPKLPSIHIEQLVRQLRRAGVRGF